MTTNEFYYLILVLGAFGSFAVGVVIATVRYKAWLRRQERVATARLVRAPAAAQPVLARAA